MWLFLCNECPPPGATAMAAVLSDAQGVPQRSMMKFHSAVLHPGNGCSQTQVLPKRGEMNEERLWSGGHFCEVGEGWEKSHFYCLLSERARVYLNWGDSQINQKNRWFFSATLKGILEFPHQNGTHGCAVFAARSPNGPQRAPPHPAPRAAVRPAAWTALRAAAALRDRWGTAARAGPLGGQSRRRHDGGGRGVPGVWRWEDVCVTQHNRRNRLDVQCAVAV